MTDKMQIFSLSVGEMHLKGGNRKFFSDKLIKDISDHLKDLSHFSIRSDSSKIIVEVLESEKEKALERLSNVFGIAKISESFECGKDMEEIKELALKKALKAAEEHSIKTFKVNAVRADKTFELTSPDIVKEIGAYILKNSSGLSVDVKKPQFEINIEIRKKAYVSTLCKKGRGGMPKATNGKALTLLSGGIDSPVAFYMTAKRGVKTDCVHFHSYPFTSGQAINKVMELRDILEKYVGKIKIYSCNMTDAYTEINRKCEEKYTTVLARRIMMRIASHIAFEHKYDVLVTGENIGQVASQTMDSIKVVDEASKIPVLRPLIAMDKTEIVERAEDIGTYEKSIEPYDDCCGIFSPKHPETKPKLCDILKEEEKLDIGEIIKEIIEGVEII